jgi:hypothetical protein
MSRKILSLAVLAAAFTLALSTTDAQARSCHSHRHHRHHGCCQTSNCGNQQVANYGCQQTQQASYVTTNTCCTPRATCCGAQPACATSVIPASFSAPQPPVEQAAPAPAPGT